MCIFFCSSILPFLRNYLETMDKERNVFPYYIWEKLEAAYMFSIKDLVKYARLQIYNSVASWKRRCFIKDKDNIQLNLRIRGQNNMYTSFQF